MLVPLGCRKRSRAVTWGENQRKASAMEILFLGKKGFARALFHPSGERALWGNGTKYMSGSLGGFSPEFCVVGRVGRTSERWNCFLLVVIFLLAMQMNVVPTLPPRVPG